MRSSTHHHCLPPRSRWYRLRRPLVGCEQLDRHVLERQSLAHAFLSTGTTGQGSRWGAGQHQPYRGVIPPSKPSVLPSRRRVSGRHGLLTVCVQSIDWLYVHALQHCIRAADAWHRTLRQCGTSRCGNHFAFTRVRV